MFYILYLKHFLIKYNNNILSNLSNDIISLILRIMLLKNRFITFGENSKLKIILIRLALVCKNFYDILKNDKKIIDICLGKDLFYNIGSFNEHCKSTYADCSSFIKLNTICRSIIWTNYKNIIIKSSNNELNYDLLVINNYKFSDEDEVLYELIRWIGINKKFIHTNLLKLNYYFLEDNNLNLLFESTDLSLNYLDTLEYYYPEFELPNLILDLRAVTLDYVIKPRDISKIKKAYEELLKSPDTNDEDAKRYKSRLLNIDKGFNDLIN